MIELKVDYPPTRLGEGSKLNMRYYLEAYKCDLKMAFNVMIKGVSLLLLYKFWVYGHARDSGVEEEGKTYSWFGLKF